MIYEFFEWFISQKTIEPCGLSLLYNNSEAARFFHGFMAHDYMATIVRAL